MVVRPLRNRDPRYAGLPAAKPSPKYGGAPVPAEGLPSGAAKRKAEHRDVRFGSSARDHENKPLAKLLLLPLGAVSVQGTLRDLARLSQRHMLVAEHSAAQKRGPAFLAGLEHLDNPLLQVVDHGSFTAAWPRL